MQACGTVLPALLSRWNTERTSVSAADESIDTPSTNQVDAPSLAIIVSMPDADRLNTTTQEPKMVRDVAVLVALCLALLDALISSWKEVEKDATMGLAWCYWCPQVLRIRRSVFSPACSDGSDLIRH